MIGITRGFRMLVKKRFKVPSLAMLAVLASANIASAQNYGGWWWRWRDRWRSGGGDHGGGGNHGGGGYSEVPEIDASAGLLALAAVAAAFILAWELRRRRSNARSIAVTTAKNQK
ncbi:MAG: VPEID-CTERM sorting domain-containing protein [Pseudomonadota bacterium]